MLLKTGLLLALALLQSSTRPVTGLVVDKRGNALPGAVVQLENTANLNVRSYITRKDGVYHFEGLNDDVDYTLRAHYRNYWSEEKTLSKFNSSKEPKVNLTIPIE
jgi:hypothetical protein